MANEALEAAREQSNNIHILSTGIRIKLKTTSTFLIQATMSKIANPSIPTQEIEENGHVRKVENPLHPQYVADLEQAQIERGIARIEAILLWGVELVDGLPPDDTWLPRLQFMERQDSIDLSTFDLDNPIDKEFVYKKFIAIGDEVDKDGENVDIKLILAGNTTTTEEGVQQAESLFPSDKSGDSNTESELAESEGVS